MAFEQLFRFVFILYCMTVGLVLLVAPWMQGWDRMVASLVPIPGLRLLGVPLMRGALSGFGLVHLVWGVHDLSVFLRPPHDDQDSPAAGDQ